MERLPDAESARRAAGGDGAAFVRVYDRYSASIFETVLAATGSVDTASAATQAAFLRLLSRPPALGAPDDEVAERLRSLALGAAVAGGEALPATGVAGGVGWLRDETVKRAGERFGEDWSAYLVSPAVTPARLPPPAAPAPAPAARPVARAEPAARAEATAPGQPAAPPRRSAREVVEELPLRSAGLVVLLLAVATAALALTGTEPGPSSRASDTAAASETGAEERGQADSRQGAGRTGKTRRADRMTGTGGPVPAAGARRAGPHQGGASAPHRSGARAVRHVAGTQRRAAAPRRTATQGPAPVTRRPPASAPDPAPPPAPTPPPEPAPEPAPAPAPAPEPAPAPRADADHGSGRNCHSKHAADPC